MPFHHTGKTFAFAGPDNINIFLLIKNRDGNRIANFVLLFGIIRQPHFSDKSFRSCFGFFGMSDLRLLSP